MRLYGASTWLSMLPLKDHHFDLYKNDFRDAICLWYGWRPSGLPVTCACGSSFSIKHALSCPHGGYPIQRHNHLRNLTAKFFNDICPSVFIEPPLQPLTGERFQLYSANTDSGARLDVAADGFWSSCQRAFFNIRVFNPLAQSLKDAPLAVCYHRNEQEKKMSYNE